MLLQERIQDLHAELVSRTQNQFSPLPSKQWFGGIHGKSIEESNRESSSSRSSLELISFRLQVYSNLQ